MTALRTLTAFVLLLFCAVSAAAGLQTDNAGLGQQGPRGMSAARQLPPQDLHAVVSGIQPDGTYLYFGAPNNPPLPADYFGPGSDPFEGQIALEGVPGDLLPGNNTSCLVQRQADPFAPGDPPGSNLIATEIVELSLASTEPIMVTYEGGMYSEPWDLFVTLSVIPAPAGEVFATKTHVNGGVYESWLPVLPHYLFKRVTDGTEVVMDVGLEGGPHLEFLATDGYWVHQMNPAFDILAPSDGMFVPGVEELAPGDPQSQDTRRLHADEASGAGRLALYPAQPIPPEDPLATISGIEPDGSFVAFGSGVIPPLPADFFGPGSDPFEGQVALDGEPLDEDLFGDASSLVLRSVNPLQPSAPVGASAEIEVEIVALDLVSVEPIIVTYDGGLFPELWDMRVRLSTVPAPVGVLAAPKTHPNGGTFTTSFFVQPKFEFARIGDGMQVTLDTGLEGMEPLAFEAGDGWWVHAAYPDLDVIAPSDGMFVPGVEEAVPGDPSSQVLRRLHANELSGAARHTVIPARPTLSGLSPVSLSRLVVKSYPNPFNPSTRIEYTVPRGGALSIGIYDLQGRLVKSLLHGVVAEGTDFVVWDGTDDSGRAAASGVYVCRLAAGPRVETRRMVLVR